MMSNPIQPTVIKPKSLARTVELLSGAFASGEVGASDAAHLKLTEIHQRPSVAFLRVAYRYLPERWENQTRPWMAITSGIAWMSPRSHQGGLSVGQVLAEHGYSETRFERLLSADPTIFPMLLVRTAYFLATKQTPVDWIEFAHLALEQDQVELERIRMTIARDFYRPRSIRHKRI